MRLLVFIEPTRNWNSNAPPFWLDLLRRVQAALDADGVGRDEMVVVGGRNLALELSEALPKSRFLPLDWTQIERRVGMGRHAISERLRTERNEAIEAALAEAVQAAVAGFAPDVCLSVGHGAFLARAFPETGCLHLGDGMFSGPPFPRTASIDPFGVDRFSALTRFGQEILQRPATPAEHDFVQQLREHFVLQLFGGANPVEQLVGAHVARHRATMLAIIERDPPIRRASGHAHGTATERLEDLLRATPPDVAVIAVEDGETAILDPAGVAYLRGEFPNFLFDTMFRAVRRAGQHLIGHCDVVHAETAPIALQSLLWRKKLLAPPDSALAFVADGHGPADLDPALKARWTAEKENALAWLLTRYQLPIGLLMLPTTLRTRLETAAPVETEASQSSWFQRIGSTTQLRAAFVKPGAPAWAAAMLSPIDDPDVLNVSLYSAAVGAPFSEESCARRVIRLSAETQEIEISTPVYDGAIGAIRLDLGERPSAFLLQGLSVRTREREPLWRWDGGAELFDRAPGMLATPAVQARGVLIETLSNDPQLQIPCEGPLAERKALVVVIELVAAPPATIAAVRAASARRQAAIGPQHADAIASVRAALDALAKLEQQRVETENHARGALGEQLSARVAALESALSSALSGLETRLGDRVRYLAAELSASTAVAANRAELLEEALSARQGAQADALVREFAAVREAIAAGQAEIVASAGQAHGEALARAVETLSGRFEAQRTTLERELGRLREGIAAGQAEIVASAGQAHGEALAGAVENLSSRVEAQALRFEQRIEALRESLRSTVVSLDEGARSERSALAETVASGLEHLRAALHGAIDAGQAEVAMRAVEAQGNATHAAFDALAQRLSGLGQSLDGLGAELAALRDATSDVQAELNRGVEGVSVALGGVEAAVHAGREAGAVRFDGLHELVEEASRARELQLHAIEMTLGRRLDGLDAGLNKKLAGLERELAALAERALGASSESRIDQFESQVMNELARLSSADQAAIADELRSLREGQEAGAERTRALLAAALERHIAAAAAASRRMSEVKEAIAALSARLEETRAAVRANGAHHGEWREGEAFAARAEALERQLQELTARHARACEDAARWREESEAIRSSTSWRLTAPLRQVIGIARGGGRTAAPSPNRED